MWQVVSSWLQQLIQSMPQHEFVIWAIGAQEKQQNHMANQLPQNVVSFQDVYLDSVLKEKIAENPRRTHLSAAQFSSCTRAAFLSKILIERAL